MKKVISILLTVIFAFALVLPVSFAADVTLPTASSPRYAADNGLSAAGSTIEMVQNASVAGSVNAKYFIAKERTTSQLQRIHWQIKDYTETSDNFIIWEAWFLPVDNNFLCVAIQKSGTEYVSKVEKGWTVGRWNHVRAVYESTNSTRDSKGKTHFYINGKHISTVPNTKALNNDMRFSFESNADSATPTGQNYQKVYIQKPYMYFASTNPGADGAGYAATFTNENINVFEDKIVNPINVTVDGLAVSDGAAIRVYSDSTFATQIADDAVISAGNVVVIDKGGKLDYYDVTGELKTVIYNAEKQPEWTVNLFAEKNDVTAYGGKASDDTSKYYELPANSQEGSLQFVYPLPYHYRYVVAKYSFYFDNDEIITGTLITTGGNDASSAVRSSYVKSGEWNNVIVLIDTQETKSKVYLNGALFQDWTEKPAQFLSDKTDKKKEFRLRFEGTADGTVRTFAVDDFEMYTTTALPEVEKDYKSLSGSYVTTTGEAFYKSGDTVESILSDTKYQAEGATAVVYDTATGAAVTTGNIPSTAKLALRTDDSTIKSYDLVAVTGIKAWDNGAGSKNGFAFADSGVMIAARYVGGRFVSFIPVPVENGMVKAQMQYTGQDGEEVKFFVWDSLAGMQPVYPSVTAN